MNAKQQATIATLVKQIIDSNTRVGSSDVKVQEVKEIDGYVFLYIEMGMPNDEGTAAAIFCRDRRHIMIGVAGGCRLLNSTKPATQSKGIYHCVNNLTK